MSALIWILTVGGIAGAAVILSRGNLANIFEQLKKTQTDTASQVVDQVDGVADLANVAAESAKDIAQKLWTPPKSAREYIFMIDNATRAFNLPPLLLARVLWQESHFRPDIISGMVRSPRGATGIAQFMPETAEEYGIDPTNPREAIPAAAKYLRSLYDKFNDWEKAIAAYNWGQGNVERKWNGVEKLPKETHDYVLGVLGDIGLI